MKLKPFGFTGKFAQGAMVAMVVVIGVGVARAESASHTIDDYVQDGLVAHFDGICNGGRGQPHNSTTTTWKELTGKSSDGTIANRNVSGWREGMFFKSGPDSPGYAQTAYIEYTLPQDFIDNFNAGGGYTLEFLTHFIKYSAGYGPLFALGGYNISTYLNLKLDAYMLYHKSGEAFRVSGLSATTTNTVAVVFDGTGVFSRYLNGTLNSASANYWVTKREVVAPNGKVGMFSDGAGQWGSSSDVYAIRIYKRTLTPMEIMRNHRTDDERFFGSNVTYIVSVAGDYGEPTPAKGLNRVEPGIGFSITGGVEALSAGERMVMTDWKWQPINGAAVTGTTIADAEAIEVADDGEFTWNWKRQFQLTATAGEGGSVSEVSGWKDADTQVTITATPAAGYKFLSWSGEIGEPADATSATITLTMKLARTVKANFVATGHEAGTATFALKGSTGVYSWNDADTWGGAIPGEGDDVVIEGESGKIPSIVIDGPMPTFKNVTVKYATVIFKGWHNALRATGDVTISSFGTLTHTNATYDLTAEQSRVWVVCDNFSIVNSGSAINVTGKGWPSKKGAIGIGPMANSSNHGQCSGGVYGGLVGEGGGYGRSAIEPYGSIEHPRDLGPSGSATDANAMPGSGGGAVLIEASGQVTINGGGIQANGTDGSGSGFRGGGAGGSIEIDCATITGSGTLQASGGTGAAWGVSGSGGRIAINCNASAQDALGMSSLTFLVRPGTGWNNVHCFAGFTCYSEHGTLYLSAKSLLNTNVNVSAQVYLPTPSWEVDELVIPNQRRLEFPQDGFQLKVKGDVTLNGSSGLVLGGEHLLFYGDTTMSYNKSYNQRTGTDAPRGFLRIGGALAASATIGGNLTMAGSTSEIVLYPKSTGEALDANGCPAGAVLEVGKTLTMKSGAIIYPISCGTNGISCSIRAKNLDVQSGAAISASYRGFFGGCSESYVRLPGQTVRGYSGSSWVGNSTKTGGSHGGLGGNVSDSRALYDDAEHPVLPGAGSSVPDNGGAGGTGGGVVHIEVAKTAKVEGSMDVLGAPASGNGHACAAAGGAIYLKTKRLYLGETAQLKAKGCDAMAISGAGGGGRIALWRAFDVAGTALDLVDTSLPTSMVYTVAGGTCTVDANQSGGDGTFVLGRLPCPSSLIIVR